MGVRGPRRFQQSGDIDQCRRCGGDAVVFSHRGVCAPCNREIRAFGLADDYPWAYTVERVLALSTPDREAFWRWIVERVASTVGRRDTAVLLRGYGVDTRLAPAPNIVGAVKIVGHLAWIQWRRELGFFDDLKDERLVELVNEAFEEAEAYARFTEPVTGDSAGDEAPAPRRVTVRTAAAPASRGRRRPV